MIQVIAINLDLPVESDVKTVPDQELASAMDVEIKAFEEWFRTKGNDPLVGAERAILKTFLAWKLRYEEGLLDHPA